MNVNSKGQRRYFIPPGRYISKAMKNCFFICSTYRYNRFKLQMNQLNEII